MKKKLLPTLFVMSLICICILGYQCSTPKPEGDMGNKDLASAIKTLHDILKAQGAINPNFRVTKEDSVKTGWQTYRDTLWHAKKADSTMHRGYITLYDIMTMIMENTNPNNPNNALAFYPVLIKSKPDAKGNTVDSVDCIACRGAYLTPDKKEILFSKLSQYYYSSWCPAVCPAQGVCQDKNTGGNKKE